VSDTAHYTCAKLHIPSQKQFLLHPSRNNVVLEESELDLVDKRLIHGAFKKLFDPLSQGNGVGKSSLRDSVRRHASSFLVIAAVFAGLLTMTLKTGLPLSTYDVTPSPKYVVPAASSVANSGLRPTSTSSYLVNSKSVGLAIFQAPSQELATGPWRTASSSPCAATVATEAATDISARPQSTHKSKELSLRPASTVHIVEESVPQREIPMTGQQLSPTNAAEPGLSQALSVAVSVKALVEYIGDDVRVIIDALDDLIRALHQQASYWKSDLQSLSTRFSDELWRRNGRAHEKAKQLKSMGENVARVAGEGLKNGVAHIQNMFGRATCAANKYRKSGLRVERQNRADAAGQWMQECAAEKDLKTQPREHRKSMHSARRPHTRAEQGVWFDAGVEEIMHGVGLAF